MHSRTADPPSVDRPLFWLNTLAGAVGLAISLLAVTSLFTTHETSRVAALEQRGWTFFWLAVFTPTSAAFLLTGYLFKHHSRWRWLVQVLPFVLGASIFAFITRG